MTNDEVTSGQEFGRDDVHAGFCGRRAGRSGGGWPAVCGLRYQLRGCHRPLVEFEAETGVVEPEFAVTNRHIAAAQLDVTVAGGTNFRASQDDADDQIVRQFVIKPRATVDDRWRIW